MSFVERKALKQHSWQSVIIMIVAFVGFNTENLRCEDDEFLRRAWRVQIGVQIHVSRAVIATKNVCKWSIPEKKQFWRVQISVQKSCFTSGNGRKKCLEMVTKSDSEKKQFWRVQISVQKSCFTSYNGRRKCLEMVTKNDPEKKHFSWVQISVQKSCFTKGNRLKNVWRWSQKCLSFDGCKSVYKIVFHEGNPLKKKLENSLSRHLGE